MHANFSRPSFWLTSYAEKKNQHTRQAFIYIICGLLLIGTLAPALSAIAENLAAQ